MTVEWDDRCNMDAAAAVDFLNEVENQLETKNYGRSVSKIIIVVVCRPHDFKQRKRFVKRDRHLFYDVVLDFYLLKNLEHADRVTLVKYQMIKTTQEIFRKYKFEDFDSALFLTDFQTSVETTDLKERSGHGSEGWEAEWISH